MMNVTKPPSSTPSGMIEIMVNPPANTPTATEMPTISTKAPIMYGSRRLSSLRWMSNACHNWARRSRAAALRAAAACALAALFSSAVRGLAIITKDTYVPSSLRYSGRLAVPGIRGAAANGLLVEPSGPVGRSHQRPGQHPRKAEPLGVLGELDELLGLHPALDRVVARRRTQVLRDGDDVAAGIAQVGERGAHLVGGFAQPEDEVALGDQAEVARRGEHVQAALVGEGGPNPFEDAGHRFDVVRQHFRARLEDLGKSRRLAVEVRDQQFDAGRRVEPFDGTHRRGVQPGRAVGQVIAGNAGDRGIAQ